MEILILSLVAGFVCFIMPRKNHFFAGLVALLSSAANLYFGIKLFISKEFSCPKLFPSICGLFSINDLNAFTAAFITFFGFIIVLYSIRYINTKIKRPNEYYAYLLWTVCVSCLAVLANNIILFLLMWGTGAFLLYLLIAIKGSEESSAAAKKTLIIVGGSDAVMFFGAAILWKLTGTLNMDAMHVAVTGTAGVTAFLCLLIGAMAKAGAIPFHTWIPDSSKAAPIPVMAILPASLDKLLGIYLLTRCVTNIFVIQQDSFLSMLLMIIGAVTIIGAVMMALIQHDFRKLLSYHAVSQVGYMILGIGSATMLGIAGGLFHMLNHAIYKSCLFLTGASVEYRTHETELDKMGGLAKLMPITFICSVIASLSISGVPPFNGFFSKWMIYQGLIQRLGESGCRFTLFSCLIAAMFSSALTLASFMKFLHAMFLGQPSPAIAKRQEVPFSMWLPVALLSLLCVLFGVFANQLPLKYFIYPAIGAVPDSGSYAPVISTILIAAGIIVGIIIYYLSGIKKAARQDTYFIGGEVLPLENKVSGVDFYANIKELQLLKNIYNKAERGFFDIYEQGRSFIFGIAKFFQYLHNGVLPTYLVWTLLGMMVLFFSFMR